MAIVKGFITTTNPTPGASSTTFNHNQNVGTDGLLVVTVAQNNAQSVTGVTYNGVAMTQIHTRDLTSITTRYTSFYLIAPATGNNNVIVSYSANVWNPVSLMAQSFTGASGIGNEGTTALLNSVNTQAITISAGSIIFGAGISSYTVSTITIDGTATVSPNFDVDHSVNGKRFTGEFSSVIATAGSKNVSIDTAAPSFQNSNVRFEIQEGGGGGGFDPSTPDDGDFFMMF